MEKGSRDRIEAEVVLRSQPSGQNLEREIRTDSVQRGKPPVETIETVANKLRELGFEVVALGSGSISIAGPEALFESNFKAGVKESSESETLEVPDELADHVEGIYLQSPPTYFKQ